MIETPFPHLWANSLATRKEAKSEEAAASIKAEIG